MQANRGAQAAKGKANKKAGATGGAGAGAAEKKAPPLPKDVLDKVPGSVTISAKGIPKYWCNWHNARGRHHPDCCSQNPVNEGVSKEVIKQRQAEIDAKHKK